MGLDCDDPTTPRGAGDFVENALKRLRLKVQQGIEDARANAAPRVGATTLRSVGRDDCSDGMRAPRKRWRSPRASQREDEDDEKNAGDCSDGERVPRKAHRGGGEQYEEPEADSEEATTDEEACRSCGPCLKNLRFFSPTRSAEEAFERGREAGADLVISFVPEALRETERITRARCIQDCSDDVSRRAQDAELARLQVSPWFPEGVCYWSCAQKKTSFFSFKIEDFKFPRPRQRIPAGRAVVGGSGRGAADCADVEKKTGARARGAYRARSTENC